MKIVRGMVIGNLNEHTADGILRATNELAEKHCARLDWLIDLNGENTDES
ncbi:MAG: hypothetical protein ISR58_17005 [Anaerolineales bacterium]|nr:hypothetical protein [Anaerolineales bacterium]